MSYTMAIRIDSACLGPSRLARQRTARRLTLSGRLIETSNSYQRLPRTQTHVFQCAASLHRNDVGLPFLEKRKKSAKGAC